jgi:hypothetical protein
MTLKLIIQKYIILKGCELGLTDSGSRLMAGRTSVVSTAELLVSAGALI